MSTFGAILIFVTVCAPVLIAAARRSSAAGLVFVLWLATGITGIGWLAALWVALFSKSKARLAAEQRANLEMQYTVLRGTVADGTCDAWNGLPSAIVTTVSDGSYNYSAASEQRPRREPPPLHS